MANLFVNDTSKILNMIKTKYKNISVKDKYAIRCDSGWKDIIDECLTKTDELCEIYDKKIIFDEVKEKFGQCRIYMDVDYDHEFKDEHKDTPGKSDKTFIAAVDRLMAILEGSSQETCEVCGNKSKGIIKPKGNKYWVKSLCEPCDNELYERIEKQKKEVDGSDLIGT